MISSPGECECILGDQQALWREAGTARQQDIADPAHRLRVAGEPSDRIEACGEIDDAVGRNEAVRGADAVDAAIASRQADRAAAIGAEREVDEAACDGDRRSARGAAGNPPRRIRVRRRAVMHVLAVEAIGHLVGVGLADHAGAGGEQALDRRGRSRGRRMGLEPDRVAVAGAMAGDVEHVLDGEGQAAQRTVRRAAQFDMGVAAEGIVGIAQHHCGRCRVAGCRDTVLRPRLKA